jgi:heme/copper-type cytochrome/quinol oxidase subunit 4
MPLVFVVAGSAPPEGITVGFALSVVLTIAAVGAVVGAVHGLALVWLLRRRVS